MTPASLQALQAVKELRAELREARERAASYRAQLVEVKRELDDVKRERNRLAVKLAMVRGGIK